MSGVEFRLLTTSKHVLLSVQGFKRDELNTERFLNLRYDGTDVPVMTHCAEGGDYAQVGTFACFHFAASTCPLHPVSAVLHCDGCLACCSSSSSLRSKSFRN